MKDSNKKKTRFASLGAPMLLTSLSLICVGFASWVIMNGSNTDMDLDVDAAVIVDAKIFSDAKVTSFDLTRDGLIQDEKKVSAGSIVVTLKINNTYCSDLSYLDSSNNLNITLTLTCTDATFLSTYVSAPTTSNGTPTQVGSDGNVYSVSTTIDASTAETDFTVTYTVTDNDTSPASSYYGQDIKFTFKAEAGKQ